MYVLLLFRVGVQHVSLFFVVVAMCRMCWVCSKSFLCVCGCVCNISSGVASASANGSVSSCKSDNVEGTVVEGAAGG